MIGSQAGVRRLVCGVVAGAAAMVVAMPGSSGAAVGSGYVLDLQFDEPSGATTAVDDSGMGHHGAIGSHVVMNGSYADWDRHPPNTPPAYGVDHLVVVPDAADHSLDPGTGNFSVEFRFRTKEKFGNILQKGQARTVGGQVKFQIPKGRLGCMFRTPEGMATATSGSLLLNDNLWHTVRCDRTPTSVTLYVDGVQVGRRNAFTGNLNNTKPWTFGGKLECDQIRVTCDYFAGEIDYVRMTKG
jgi:concanavalin A-like lectin/glucanase superfamily protein